MPISHRICNEITLRIILCAAYLSIEMFFDPVERVIQREEAWMHRYPMTKSYCSILCLWSTILLIWSTVLMVNYYQTQNEEDKTAAILAFTLSIATTALLTRLFKFVAGKPRPDFLERCKPRSLTAGINTCTGSKRAIREGRQSFPSGHSSLAFSGLGFSSLYLMGKLRVRVKRGPGEAWRVILCLLPIVIATVVAITRICDYHHFPADVVAGSLLGALTTIICYHHYYPPFYSPTCHIPYPSLENSQEMK